MHGVYVVSVSRERCMVCAFMCGPFDPSACSSRGLVSEAGSLTMGWYTAEGRRSLESGGPFALDAMLANGGLLVQCVCKVHVCMCSACAVHVPHTSRICRACAVYVQGPFACLTEYVGGGHR